MSSTPPSRLSLYLDLIRWSRPAGWLLLLWPTLSALWLAAGGFPGWHLVVVFTLGTILIENGDLQSAFAFFNEAVRLDPTLVQAHYSMGTIQYTRGNIQSAIKAYQEALRLKPDFA